MPGCPVYGGLPAYGGEPGPGQGAGWAGRPPCRCCFRARWARPGTSAGSPACARLPSRCLPFPAARPVILGRASAVVPDLGRPLDNQAVAPCTSGWFLLHPYQSGTAHFWQFRFISRSHFQSLHAQRPTSLIGVLRRRALSLLTLAISITYSSKTRSFLQGLWFASCIFWVFGLVVLIFSLIPTDFNP